MMCLKENLFVLSLEAWRLVRYPCVYINIYISFSDIPDFFLVGIHTKPSEAVAELNCLDDVFEKACTEFKTRNGIILGDFNADCSYLSAKEHRSLDLVKDISFCWLLNRKEDTTTTHSLCSYDRYENWYFS